MLSARLLFAEVSAELVGTIVGYGVVFCLLAAGILKSAQIARRPNTHSLCAYALLIVLTGMLAGGVLAALARAQLLGLGVRLALSALVLCMYVAALVTAVIGLADIRKHREAYTQGSAQAKWAAALSLIFLMIAGGSIYWNLKPLLGNVASDTPKFEAKRPAGEDELIGSLKKPGFFGNSADQGELNRTRLLDEFNASFRLPDEPWVEIDAQSFISVARLALHRSEPATTFYIIPERIGVETDVSTRKLADVAQENLRSAADSFNFHDERVQTHNGLEGLRFETDAVVQGQKIHYATWVVVNNGFGYQLVTTGPQDATAAVDMALDDLCSRFRQIDPDKVAHLPSYSPAKDFESRNFGYRVELAGTGWAEVERHLSESTGNEFSAQYGAKAWLYIVPVQLCERETDLEVLTKAMFGQAGSIFPGTDIIAVTPFELAGRNGRSIEASNNADGVRHRGLFRLIVGQRSAILAGGWMLGDDADTRSLMETALDKIRIIPNGESPAPELSVPQKINSAYINNELGIAAVREMGDLAAAEAYFALATRLSPGDEAMLGNHVDVLMRLSRTRDALEIINRRVEQLPQHVTLRALQARLLADQGEPQRARQILAELFQQGYTEEGYLLLYIQLAMDALAFDEAIGVLDKVVSNRPTTQIRRWHAVLHSRKGDHEKAVVMLRMLRQQYPSDAGVALDLADVYEQKGDFSAALEITQQLMDAGQRDEMTLLAHGRIQLQLHWYAKAKETFERGVALYPGSSQAKEFLAHTSNMLGEGDNSLVKTPLRPVAMPAGIRDRIRAARHSPAATQEHDAHELLAVTGIEFYRGKPLRTTFWNEVKIHTTGGVTRYSSLTLKFDPSYERVFVNRLAVLDPSGKQVAQGSGNDYYVLDDTSSRMAKGEKVLNIPVPGLKAGYTLQYVVTTEQLVPSDEYRFQMFAMISTVPCAVNAFLVQGDVGDLVVKSTEFADVKRSKELIYCLKQNLPPYSWEQNQASSEHYLPLIWVGESRKTWEELGRDYLKLIESKLAISKEVRRMAAELTADTSTQREKLATLAAHVQDAYTYQAIEFGRRALIPNSAAHTLRLKYGDCKDHAVLLWQLLRSVEIPAHLALVNTSSILRHEMPSLDQFNHMVVFVPQLDTGSTGSDADEGCVLDCTDKDAFALLSPPIGLADKDLLILDEKKPRIVRTGKFPADAARLVSRRKIKIIAGESAGDSIRTEVDEEVTLNEFVAPVLRGYLKMYEPADRVEALQGFFKDGQRLRLTDVQFENLDDVAKPLTVKVKYAATEAFHTVKSAKGGATVVGRLPAPWETTYMRADFVQARKTPFEFMMPVRLESTIEFELPKGFRLQDANQLADAKQTRFLAWASRVQPNNERVTVEYRARRFAGRHRSDDYAAYFDDMRSAVRLFDRPLTIQAGPSN